MPKVLPWLILVALIATIELTVRLAIPFDLHRVLVVESLLLFSAGIASWALIARTPEMTGWRNRLRWVLLAAFVLGGLRAALWALGVPVAKANVIIAAIGAIILIIIGVRRRLRQRRTLSTQAQEMLPPNKTL